MPASNYERFVQLCRSARENRIALIAISGTSTREFCELICDVRQIGYGLLEFIPLAKPDAGSLDSIVLTPSSPSREVHAPNLLKVGQVRIEVAPGNDARPPR